MGPNEETVTSMCAVNPSLTEQHNLTPLLLIIGEVLLIFGLPRSIKYFIIFQLLL